MKANNYISRLEHKLLLAVAVATLLFSIVGFAAYVKKDSDERDEYYRIQAENKANNGITFSGPYCFPNKHPQFLFSIILILGLTFSSLYVAKKFLLSSLLTIASLSMFVYWFYDTQKILSYNDTTVINDLDRILYKAGDFDVIVLLLVSSLLFWQISILLRMLVKTLQKEKALP